MASNSQPQPRSDENPYFPSSAGEAAAPQTSNLAPSTSAPPNPPISATGASTPAREQPPHLPKPRPGFYGANTANRQQSSIGLRRLGARPSRAAMVPSANDFQQRQDQSQGQGRGQQSPGIAASTDGRRRSTSAPDRPTWIPDQSQGSRAPSFLSSVPEGDENTRRQRGRFLARGRRPSWLPRMPTRQQQQEGQEQQAPPDANATRYNEYDPRIVDLLDVVDPEVSTLTSITNLQNSLFIPQLGRFVNRRPTYDVSSWGPRPVPGNFPESLASIAEGEQQPPNQDQTERPSSERAYSITSNVEDSHYAVLPHGATLEGWSKEDVDQLNDHVRHMLHSRRSKFKRSMKGFGSYVRRPLGFLVTLYATLITLFGLAWVLFLIGWINVGGKQLYLINIIDYTLVALFAIVGDGLAPFRIVDTYHMIYIAHYHHLSWKLRKKLLLPDLRDHNDLPTEAVLPDLESAHDTASIPSLPADEEFSVLTLKQQEKLTHHQTKYSNSHTFYRPHETETHYAFPLRLLVAITVLLDLHSCLQISLGSVTWGIDYRDRPFALTTVILCCSITANATAGLLIWIGDRRTRKKDVIERMSRQELTEEAMRKVKKENQKEAEKARAEEEARREEEEGGRKSLSLPRLSLDKLAAGVTGHKGEGSTEPKDKQREREKDVIREEEE